MGWGKVRFGGKIYENENAPLNFDRMWMSNANLPLFNVVIGCPVHGYSRINVFNNICWVLSLLIGSYFISGFSTIFCAGICLV